MTEKEMRELDAWIAEHVMGWTDVEWHRSPNEFPEPECAPFLRGHKPKCTMWRAVPFFSGDDPAAAMMVLEKCAGVDTLVITNSKVAEHPWVIVGRKTCHRSCQPTLPLAIALFAKQLYGKL